MRYIVDQVKENLVTCEKEDKTLEVFSVEQFPKQLQVGDVVEKNEQTFIILEEETNARKHRIKQLMNSLWED